MNRGRLFATIERIERGLERPKRPGASEHSSPPSTPSERAERLSRPVLTASPTALATAAKRARQTRTPTVVRTPVPDPKGAVKLTAKALKVTLVLDAAVFGKLEVPQGKAAPLFVIEADGREVKAQIPAKRLRKVLATIAEHGADKVAVILQGKLAADTVIAEAGLVAQVKTPKLAQQQ